MDERTPKIKIRFILTAKEPVDVDWDYVSKVLGISSTKTRPVTKGSGKVSQLTSDVWFTAVPAVQGPYDMLLHPCWEHTIVYTTGENATDTAEALHTYEQLYKGKGECIKVLCEKLHLRASLQITVYNSPMQNPAIEIDNTSLMFWATTGISIELITCDD